MSHDALSRNARWALFLDVDGTLIELASTPDSVHVPDALKSLLDEVSTRLEGALALVSGRSIADLDRLFAPKKFCASGVHGAERREPTGEIVRAHLDTTTLDAVRDELAAFVSRHDGLLLEDKSFALAVHFRLAPELGDTVRAKVDSILERIGEQYTLQAGKCVYEIRPRAWSKGTAVRTFLAQAPFADRTPIYVGDDVTDEDAFRAVNELGGLSVRVGPAANTHAAFALHSVADVHRWLRELPPPAPLLRVG